MALVDAGQDQTGEAIKSELAGANWIPAAVTAILLTHGHPDHIGALGQFPQAAGDGARGGGAARRGASGCERAGAAPVSGQPDRRDRDTRAARRRRRDARRRFPYVSTRVPGHTAGSAAYFVNGVLMVGDSADVASDGSLQGSPWIFSDSQAENRASLVRLEQRLVADGANVTTIVPSHSGTASGLAPLTAFARRNE